MRASKKILTAVAAAALGGPLASAAHAIPIKYDFSVTDVDGPLAGTTSTGSFAYDSSSITPGLMNVSTDLLMTLDFVWHGIAYDASSANRGFLDFDADGRLVGFLFGSDCDAGGCNAWLTEEAWFVDYGDTIPPGAFGSTVAGDDGYYGGLAYTLGVIFFVLDEKVRYTHFVWHLFVLTGTICHFFAVLLYAF